MPVATLYADRVKETSTSTGTGDFTLLGAVSQFDGFNAEFGLNTWFEYAIAGQTGTEWETGVGYLSATTTLVRALPKDGSAGLETLVSFSAGTKDVFCTRGEYGLNTSIGIALANSSGFAWR